MNPNNSQTIPAHSTNRLWPIIILVLALGAAAYFLIHRSTAPAKTDQIVINQAAKTLLYLPLYIAQDEGFFRAEGLQVSIVTGGGDSQAFAAVVGGSADVGQGDPMMVPISRQRGGPGKIVGNIVGRVAFWGVAVDPKVDAIKQPQDFAGKRVVTYPEPMTIYALQMRNLKEAGLKAGQATIVQAQFGTELAPLFSGGADIAMTIEPVVSQALAKGAHIVYSFPQHYGDFALTGLMVNDTMVQQRPESLQRILNAYQRALTFAHQNPEGAIAVAEKEFPDVDKAIIANAVQRMLKEETIPKSVSVSMDAYQHAAQVRRDIGDLEKDIPFKDAVDNEFADEAVRLYGEK